MQTRDFLQTIFPLTPETADRAEDLIRFIVVGEDHPWGSPGTNHWRTRAQIHAMNEADASCLGFNLAAKDVYFTPHAFTRMANTVDRSDAVELVDCAWVELDDDDIPTETFKPKPTITVETSPGRFHLYWMFRTPQKAEDVEKINYRLTYGNGLKKDTGGWHLVKLLRVPGCISYKRDAPHHVEVTKYEPKRLYELKDFDDLPDAPAVMAAGMSMPMPDGTRRTNRAELQRLFSFPKELEGLLDRRHTDRSSALWRIYSICYSLGMSEEQCFFLVKSSPNDKFTDWRYNGEQGLWKDILKGYYIAHTPEETPVLREIKIIRQNKAMPATVKRREIANKIMKDLSQTGRVYFDHVKRDALYYDGTSVLVMEPTDRRWRAMLNLRYEVVDGEDEYRPVNANLYAFAFANGESVTPRTASYWDAPRGLLYVYNGAGKIYRLDGKSIDVVDNGTDGVLFRDEGIAEPFEAIQPPEGYSGPSLEDAILGLPNYDDTPLRHTREQAIDLARVWLYGLFFGEHMEARPHLVITGPTNSGKTLMFQAISELLSGEGQTVSTIPHDRTTFETAVSNSPFVFFDNVDTPNRWLMDALAEVATGIQFTRRILYSTNEMITYRVQSFLGLTTRDPWFSRTDIATRLVVLHVNRRATNKNPTDLLNLVRANRSFLWWELLTDLNKIVARLKGHVGGSYNLRMAGFADFLTVVSYVRKYDAKPLINVISGTQVSSALDHSVIWMCLEPWLKIWDFENRVPKNNDHWVTTSLLHTQLRSVAYIQGCQREYDRRVPSARSLSHQLRELVPDLQQIMGVEYDKNAGTNRYKFSLAEKDLPGPPSEDD